LEKEIKSVAASNRRDAFVFCRDRRRPRLLSAKHEQRPVTAALGFATSAPPKNSGGRRGRLRSQAFANPKSKT
jgi:hypothetical protein